ncbi:MAG: hypothetical protein D4R45_07460 [Planctomycetaceae bacterium]|nr:MAG: hypothetical protein D4R45_07460 [Planctomycetaceae bacterium]
MSEDRQQHKKTDKTKHHLRYLWAALLAVLIIAIIYCLMWKAGLLDFRSIDDKLAAIDAELAIPDAENAAVYYKRFFTDPNNEAIFYDLSDYTPSAYCEPWADIEHPELAAELKTNRAFIQTLLDISEMQNARFPVDIAPGPDSWQMARDMRKVIFVLSWAAANDLAEGRADAAHRKYRCQMQLARHFSQQPGTYHKVFGIAFEATGYMNIRIAVMRDDITQEQMRSLESILDILMDRGEGHARIAARIDSLLDEKERSMMSTVELLKQLWLGRKTQKQQEQVRHKIRLRLEAIRRATPILIALRRYKQETGVWPESLEQIEPKLPEQMLIDPQNNGPFVYKRDGDSFVFYSKGPNNIDEGGSYSGADDDWPIWPLKIKITPAGKQ